MLSDSDLTAIYKKANGEDTGKPQPLTTQRIFKAMRAIESAATAPLLAEIERLTRELEEARKDAERLDYIQKTARNDPKMDGNHVWWPTTFNKALKGPTIRAAVDAAISAAIKEQT